MNSSILLDEIDCLMPFPWYMEQCNDEYVCIKACNGEIVYYDTHDELNDLIFVEGNDELNEKIKNDIREKSKLIALLLMKISEESTTVVKSL